MKKYIYIFALIISAVVLSGCESKQEPEKIVENATKTYAKKVEKALNRYEKNLKKHDKDYYEQERDEVRYEVEKFCAQIAYAKSIAVAEAKQFDFKYDGKNIGNFEDEIKDVIDDKPEKWKKWNKKLNKKLKSEDVSDNKVNKRQNRIEKSNRIKEYEGQYSSSSDYDYDYDDEDDYEF